MKKIRTGRTEYAVHFWDSACESLKWIVVLDIVDFLRHVWHLDIMLDGDRWRVYRGGTEVRFADTVFSTASFKTEESVYRYIADWMEEWEGYQDIIRIYMRHIK